MYKRQELFRAIDACKDNFIKEAAEDIQKRKTSVSQRFFFVNSSENAEKDMKKLSGVRVAVAIVICVIVLSIGAVSYTHLDVYKRQGKGRSDGSKPGEKYLSCKYES